MRKLSEIRGLDAIDVLAEIVQELEPIIGDEALIGMLKNPETKRISIAGHVLKNHRGAVLRAMALIDGADPDKYAPSVPEILGGIMSIRQDGDFVRLFTSAAGTAASSGPATGNTAGTGEG